MLVWLVMVTGMRRGELAALRWHDVHLDGGVLEVRRSYTQRAGIAMEKDPKTHQMRRIALDQTTVDLLAAHRTRYEAEVAALGLKPRDEAFLFSYETDHSRPCNPDGISHRYVAMCAELGIDSHLHALRHYSATELLSAGVDLRTVAGRLGHGGGGVRGAACVRRMGSPVRQARRGHPRAQDDPTSSGRRRRVQHSRQADWQLKPAARQRINSIARGSK
jgi:integrase